MTLRGKELHPEEKIIGSPRSPITNVLKREYYTQKRRGLRLQKKGQNDTLSLFRGERARRLRKKDNSEKKPKGRSFPKGTAGTQLTF